MIPSFTDQARGRDACPCALPLTDRQFGVCTEPRRQKIIKSGADEPQCCLFRLRSRCRLVAVTRSVVPEYQVRGDTIVSLTFLTTQRRGPGTAMTAISCSLFLHREKERLAQSDVSPASSLVGTSVINVKAAASNDNVKRHQFAQHRRWTSDVDA